MLPSSVALEPAETTAAAELGFSEPQARLAIALYDCGAILDKQRSPDGLGFRLKLHEKNPDAPLSPIYLNLRTADNPSNKGPLTPAIVDQAAWLMAEYAMNNNLVNKWLSGIPFAGEPFAQAMSAIAMDDWGLMWMPLPLLKETVGDERKIARVDRAESDNGDRVLLIDDLITQADSKLEAWEALNDASYFVSDVLVLVDREQGGETELAANGVNLHAIFKLSDLLRFYLRTSRINPITHKQITDYLQL